MAVDQRYSRGYRVKYPQLILEEIHRVDMLIQKLPIDPSCSLTISLHYEPWRISRGGFPSWVEQSVL